ncbi:MAG: hypothetical protein PHS14_20340, partial [Elusimicrobia bacterium]|nr:hypothetical protein [Elusimicrobiota bacterium]
VPVPTPQSVPQDSKTTADMKGNVVIAEIWDKVGWRRIYLIPGYDKPVGKTTAYPYMDVYGRPLFPDFFPCAWRTPWSRQREIPARVLGLPGIEPMWGPQIEYIKTISAFILACKSSARVFLVGPGISQASLTAVAQAQDSAFVQFGGDDVPGSGGAVGNATAPANAKISDYFSQLPMPPAPRDYLVAAQQVKAEAYESVAITSASMTGQPQASTASQESMIA